MNSTQRANFINSINNKAQTPINNDKNDKTFNKLRELQILLKKESSLKELCKIIFI